VTKLRLIGHVCDENGAYEILSFLQESHIPYFVTTLSRMDNIGIVVEFLDEAISFFTELGFKLEG